MCARVFVLFFLGSAVPAYAQTVAPSVSSSPVISGNGQFVAFTSTANLDSNPGDGPTSADLFVRDLTGGVTERWTTNQAVIGLPSISADGRYVVFTTASPLVAADANAVDDVVLARSPGSSGFELPSPHKSHHAPPVDGVVAFHERCRHGAQPGSGKRDPACWRQQPCPGPSSDSGKSDWACWRQQPCPGPSSDSGKSDLGLLAAAALPRAVLRLREV